ncbi:hypothetical protein TTHERM_000293269 (macronuclear) [Tetrahymena thermophila SB210]|uniref:Uncharacterized protein n=1 Tax=Tetrahymena thermophila (strain SB210) TaxID=312017 RepID=W7XEK7_TETTS|nr:hypothetical protein TTHERM_000293269 [Tetrahymena thermophila SB210]EWS75133.1 hypothetical protein TTHERM_000293269 [Tetrahymena thermophila SB210]|eukprot:XP_012652371.1 hypothetical protein TTHERM_000293269 [Tetrahymena thermophila SB210]
MYNQECYIMKLKTLIKLQNIQSNLIIQQQKYNWWTKLRQIEIQVQKLQLQVDQIQIYGDSTETVKDLSAIIINYFSQIKKTNLMPIKKQNPYEDINIYLHEKDKFGQSILCKRIHQKIFKSYIRLAYIKKENIENLVKKINEQNIQIESQNNYLKEMQNLKE